LLTQAEILVLLLSRKAYKVPNKNSGDRHVPRPFSRLIYAFRDPR